MDKRQTAQREKFHQQIRFALEHRLAAVLKTNPKDFPTLSISEILGVLFGMHGQTNSLGHYGDTVSGIRELIGEDLLWKRPETPAEPLTAEVPVSEVVQ